MALTAKRYVKPTDGEHTLTITGYKQQGAVVTFQLEDEDGASVSARYDTSTRMGNDFYNKFLDTFIPYAKGSRVYEDEDIIGAKAVCEVKTQPKVNKATGEPWLLPDGTEDCFGNLFKVLREAE